MGWIGFDLDRTLATYTLEQEHQIGEPIWPIVNLAKKLIKEGKDVRIFTARANIVSYKGNTVLLDIHLQLIREWSIKHIGQELPITCAKDFNTEKIYDDIAVHVVPNKGKLIGEFVSTHITLD